MMNAERGPIRVVGRYALYNEIAAGGMATVHIGRLLGPVGFARTVAVKRLHPQYAKDPEFVSMFLDEARLAARVQHPNVVATIDVVATDGELFLIMDYIRGESLSKLVRTAKKQGQQMPPRIAAAIMCGFLHGLHAAHEAKNERGEPLKLVHRDVSPQNVLVGADGIARVLDFGVAKAAGRIQVTKDGQIKGKLAYMPPEQLSGREISRAVDIYASAVVMWEALTGERLFKGGTEAETLSKILRDPVRPPSAVNRSLPTTFDAPLMQALSRDPSSRQQTARELALQIERCAGIASPTEVGEWVESTVGSILSAREEQIAAIESSSASLPRIRSESGRPIPGTPDDTTTDVVGAFDPRIDAPFPATATVTDTRMTGSMSLPVDRKLPILATLAGLLVLVVVVGVIVVGRLRDQPAAPGSAASSASVAAATTTATASTAPPTAEPPPAPHAAQPAPPAATAGASAAPVTPPAAARPTARPTATVAPLRTAAPAKPKSCDPPYVIDEKGHRQYKRECL